MNTSPTPFIPRYKRVQQYKEDVLPDVLIKSRSAIEKKIKAFLEEESYVLLNQFPSFRDCGFKELPCQLLIDEFLSIEMIRFIWSSHGATRDHIHFNIVTHLWEKKDLILQYAFNTKNRAKIETELDKLLAFFCKYYTRFPISVYGMLDICEPLIVQVENNGSYSYIATFTNPTDAILCDCAKLDEIYFVSQHLELFNFDFCTNLIESAQETAGRRLSLFFENESFKWGYVPRKYKLFDQNLKLYELELELFYKRLFLKRYSSLSVSTSCTDPQTGRKIVFPPCIYTSDVLSEMRKGIMTHRQFVNEITPDLVCLETLILDTMCLFDSRMASIQEIISMMKYHPLVVSEKEGEYNDLIHMLILMLSSINHQLSFSFISIPSIKKYQLLIDDKYNCV